MPPAKIAAPLAGPFRFIALDVETANSDPSSICQIGLAGVRDDSKISTWATFVDPRARFDARNIDIHGITSDRVLGAPTFREAMNRINPLLTSHTIFQHSNFDRQAIEAACRQNWLDIPTIVWADSVRVAQRAWPELRGNGGHGLASIKKHLGLTFNHHDAEDDARASAEIVLRAEALTGQTFDSLLSRQPRRSAKIVAPVTANGNLAGEVAVFTGSLTIRREEASVLAASEGITVAANVTKKTTLLIVGDQDLSVLAGHEKSSKHRKAEELIEKGQEIRIIGQTEFMSLIGSAEPDFPAKIFDIRSYLRKNRDWQTAKTLITSGSPNDPQETFAAVKKISNALVEIVRENELTYKDTVILTKETEAMLDALIDTVNEAEDRDDYRLEQFQIALGAMESIDDTVGELLIEKSGVLDRLPTPSSR